MPFVPFPRGVISGIWNILSRTWITDCLRFLTLLLLWTRDQIGTQALTGNMEGDILLGGIFPLHVENPDGYSCGPIRFDRGIQRAEAMFFALDSVNRDPDVLPGLKLGATVVDSCSIDAYALNQSLTFVRASLRGTLDKEEYQCDDGSSPKQKEASSPLVGVVGESYSSVTILVANLLRLFKMPQISPAATSDTLSDKKRFEYFARTVPPDQYQARALVDIVQRFNWTYVSYVASDDEYGQKGIEVFLREANKRKICTGAALKVPTTPTEATYTEIIENLKKKTARAVIVFVRSEQVTGLLKAAAAVNLHEEGFIWLGTDQWGIQKSVVKDFYAPAFGAITIELQSKRSKEFDEYLTTLHPGNPIVRRNPWFLEYWETEFKCKVKTTVISTLWFDHPQLSPFSMAEGNYKWRNSSWDYCDEDKRLRAEDYSQDSKVPFVVNAVDAFAKAIHAYLKEDCLRRNPFDPCKKLKLPPVPFNLPLLYQFILNTTFNDTFGHEVKFDISGDVLPRYDIYNYQRTFTAGRGYAYDYVQFGAWDEDKLTLNESVPMQWARGGVSAPVSICSAPCKVGYAKRLQEDGCCWVCIECKGFQFLKDEKICEDCPNFFYPDENLKQTCVELKLNHMEWGTFWALIPVAIACIFGVMTAIVIVIFMLNNDTPIVRASGRELSYLILSGIMMCYCMTFFLLAYPSTAICAIQRFGVGLGFSVMYSALLTKTNRISRIFESASKSAKRPGFISPKSQMIITSILISVQVIASGIWLLIEQPEAEKNYTDPNTKSEVVFKCKTEDHSFLISLAYNMLLIITCTIYAIKTRKIPENFNESKFIGFTMYTTCIIWLAFIPIYFGTKVNFRVQVTTLCISISLSASTCLLCLFSPKIYIIVFHPEKNVRKLTMNTTTTYKKANSSAPTSANNHASNSQSDLHPKANNLQTAAIEITQRLECSEPDSITSL